MNKTRNLFVLTGPEKYVASVLNELHFKGLVTIPHDVMVSDPMICEAFRNNKSVVCFEGKYTGKYSGDAVRIYVVNERTHTILDDLSIVIQDSTSFYVQFEKIAKRLNLDIGDHKSNSSGLNGAPSVKDCAYCRYLAGQSADNERTIYSSENFFVIPTIGQFITGCLLLIPYQHIVSNAELSPALLEEFKLDIQDIEYMIRLTYNCSSVLVWENGTGSGGKGKAKDSIVHSHLHIYPSTLTSEMIESDLNYEFDTITLDDLHRYTEHSYLLIRSTDKNIWKIASNPALYIPRQYVRQLVAEEHGIEGDEWNWRTNHFSENMKQTVKEIFEALKRNWDQVPERVKKNTRSYL